jgi:hypothetical protein
MQIGLEGRPIPTRATTAFREIVRGRNLIDAARNSLELALEIHSGAAEETSWVPVPTLERVLAQLDEVEAALWEVSH